ncbi:endonuclease V isoform X6 [Sagmatias obliquidens]|uniref:endonuclease V isoform X6 n=1 Tax=Sagmatias obliquidens TaxID=3371155 RepID=UPI000F43EDBB|nr:endonuclease V isoform X6 [Lagenorhynchus obliquidens]
MARKAAGRPPEETLSLWKREQALLKTLVVDRDTEAWQRDPAFSGLQRVGGVDVSFVKGDSVSACASLVVLSYPELEVLFVDGNGVLHHRGFGVACHLGVVTDLPCIGVAKKLLQVDGLENNALHKEKIRLLKAGGDSFPLMGGSGTVLGMALKSHDHSTKPLYVSVGHKMSLEAAVRLTHGCCKFRIPEPVRQADIRSRDYIRRTLGVQGAPALRPERSKKAQRPKACPQGASEEPAGSPSLRAFSAKDGNEPHQKKWPKLQQRIWGREKEALWEVGSQKMKGLWDPPFPLGRRGRAASLASWTWRSWGSEAQEGLGALKEMGCSCCLALGKRQ